MVVGEEHVVQFNDDQLDLLTAVGRAMAIALDQGHGVVCIATDGHRQLLEKHLTHRGIDLQAARSAEEFVCLDATTTLASITRDGVPDVIRFAEVVGATVDDVTTRFPRVWAFSELVAQMCANDNSSGGNELKKSWSSLVAARPLLLHCEYPADMSSSEQDRAAFVQICDDHCRALHTGSSLALAVRDRREGAVDRA